MAKAQALFKFIETFFLSIWGITTLDLLQLVNTTGIFETIDNKIKTLMAVLGALYFLFTLPYKVKEMIHKSKVNKLELEHKMEELEKLKRENDKQENEHKRIPDDSQES